MSFASVKYIQNYVPDLDEKNILLFGTGKIGRNTCQNLIKHTGHTQLTLINRTREKAEKFGNKFQLNVKDYGDLQSEIRKCDILVVATGAHLPTVSKELIHNKKPLWILDLSMPKNVSENVKELPNVTLVHLDELSQITDETLAKRQADIPKAEAIITNIKLEFYQWLETRKFAPVIKALKNKLSALKEEELDFHSKKLNDFNSEQVDMVTNRVIQKITKQFVNHLRQATGDTENSLDVIQRVFQLQIED